MKLQKIGNMLLDTDRVKAATVYPCGPRGDEPMKCETCSGELEQPPREMGLIILEDGTEVPGYAEDVRKLIQKIAPSY